MLAIDWTYAYLVLSAVLAGVWLLLYALRVDIRRETLVVSSGRCSWG